MVAAVSTWKPGPVSHLPLGVPSYTEVFGNAMVKLAKADPKVVAVTAAMPEGTGLAQFAAQFPDRFFDVGIAEAHGVTFAAGLAVEGFKPVVAIYSTFLQRAYDQIVHDVCIESQNVVFAIDRGGIVGEDGPTHHGIFDYAYLRCLPNMIVMAPKDENELQHMLKTALDLKGPVALRYPRGTGEGVEIEDTIGSLEIGKAEVLHTGNDVVLLAIGSGVREAIKARDLLKKDNIQATVVNCRFVKPLDEELIRSLACPNPKTGYRGGKCSSGRFWQCRAWNALMTMVFHNARLHESGSKMFLSNMAPNPN